MLDHVGIGDVLRAEADFHGHGEVAHQRPKLVEQIVAKSVRMGDGDTIGARHLHLGVGAGAARHLALAGVGQAQQGVAKRAALGLARPLAGFQVMPESLGQGRAGLGMQRGQALNRLAGGEHGNKLGMVQGHKQASGRTMHSILPAER